MKRHLRMLLVLFLASSLSLSSLEAADKTKALAAKVADIVAKFPGQNTAEKDALAAELMALGPDGITSLCRMVAPPGAADDTKARFALNGLATYVASPRLEEQRKMLVRALAKALERERSPDVQSFLISQVQVAGKNESVKPLKKYLRDQRLAEPAAQALLAIGGQNAEAAILKALDAAPASNKAALIKALGDLRSRKATKKLLIYAASENATVRQSALYALANTGDLMAENAVNKAFLAASLFERTQALSLYLLYARRLTESGNKAEAIRICRTLIKNYTAPKESHVACAALSLLADAMGKNAFDDLLSALESTNKDVRWKALDLANRFQGEDITARLIEKMAGAPAEIQAEIIAALGIRGDKAAFPSVREKLKSDEKIFRLAAIPAAARLGGSEIIPDLFALLKSENSEEIALIEQALLGFSKEQVIPQAVNVLAEVPAPSQAALIKILAERGAREHIDLIFVRVKSEDERIRIAALTALEPLSSEKELPRLITLLLETTASREVTLIQNAIVASANQMAGPESRADLILEAMEKAAGEKRANLLRPLPRIGGEKALEAIVTETRSEDLEVQTAAVYALSQWPDFKAAAPLLNLCRNTGSRKFLYLALQGLVRLVSEEELDAPEKFKLLIEAMAISSEPSEKKLAIQGLSGVKTMDSLRAVASYLDDPNLKLEAALAAARIALPTLNQDDGLAGIEVIRVLKKTACMIVNENFTKQIEDYIETLLEREVFRPLFNRKDLSGWKGLVGDPPGRGQMTPQELEKAQAEADADMRAHWKVVDGRLVFDGAGHSLCAVKDYGDFELFVDWMIEKSGDSGIYLRGSPQVQIWDPDERPEGSGGLYNNQKGPNKPLSRADNPVGEWNTFYIRMTGERVTVYLNNFLVVDGVVMENYWERDKPIYPTGQIELQAHSTPLCFRNIYLRELMP